MMRVYIIANPVAGSGNGLKAVRRVREILDEAGADYEIAMTGAPGAAKRLAREAVEKGERVIAALGGDGTIREVASALCGTGAEMGILPCGTGNDFAKALNIPANIPLALSIVLGRQSRPIDAGIANDEFFLNVAGFGFDTQVIIYTERYKKRLNGMLPYMLGVLRALMRVKPMDITAVTDSGATVVTKALLLTACNGTHFGGGMNVAPQADLSDGLLDVCVVRSMSVFAFLSLLPRFIKGKHLGADGILYFKARSLKCRCEESIPINLDGELSSRTPVTFSALPGAVRIIMQGANE